MTSQIQPSEWLRLQWELIRPYARSVYYKMFPGRRPSYFRDTWTYSGGPVEKDHGRMTVSNALVCFFFPMVDWHARMQRSQHLAKSLAERECQCIYLNPHLGLEYLSPYHFDPCTRFTELEPGVFELHVHLMREHAIGQRPLTSSESAYVANEVSRLIESWHIRKAALIVSFPSWIEVVDDLHLRYGFPIIYDCHDWLPGFEALPLRIKALEDDLFKRSDAIVFSSQWLMDRVTRGRSFKAKTALIRNAIPEFLLKERRVRSGDSSTVGYLGALDYWFDVDAVARVAQDHPQWRILLAGRIEDQRIRRLEKYSNVTFLGEIPYSAVPAYLAGLDVAILPFLRNELTLAASPIKLYEYFGAGLPVVSTRLPEVELYKELAYIADTPDEFSALAAKAMREEEQSLWQRRIQVALAETWTARAQSLLEIITAVRVTPPLSS